MKSLHPSPIVLKFRAKALFIAIVAAALFLCARDAQSAEASNDLFVASFVTGNITRIDGDTGAVVYSVPQGSSRINLAKGPDGEIYASTLFTSTVAKTDLETGAPLGNFGSGGGLSTAVGVTFGPDGNLYIGSRDSDAVLRYDGITGAFIGTFVASASGGLDATEALLFGPDGNLYVTEFSGNRVLRYNGTTGAFIDVFATSPTLSGTRGLTFGPDGNLYVAGNNSSNVVRFNGTTGAFIDVFSTGIPGANGIAFGPDGNLYVASEFGNAIVRVNGTTGAVLGTFANVTGPVGIFFDLAPAFNARQLKQEAIEALEPLLSGPDSKRIAAAIAHIEDSLDDSLWADDSHLAEEGRRVFDAERKAVNELEKVKNANETVTEVIASLVEIDGTLAQIAFDEAATAGGTSDHLETAARFLEKAGGISGANAAERAIQAYRSAWIAAQKSLNGL